MRKKRAHETISSTRVRKGKHAVNREYLGGGGKCRTNFAIHFSTKKYLKQLSENVRLICTTTEMLAGALCSALELWNTRRSWEGLNQHQKPAQKQVFFKDTWNSNVSFVRHTKLLINKIYYSYSYKLLIKQSKALFEQAEKKQKKAERFGAVKD